MESNTLLGGGKMGDLPVYKIKPEVGPGQIKTVHRNLLLPMGELVGALYGMGHDMGRE